MPTGTARNAMIATAEAMRKRVIVVPSQVSPDHHWPAGRGVRAVGAKIQGFFTGGSLAGSRRRGLTALHKSSGSRGHSPRRGPDDEPRDLGEQQLARHF